MLQLDLSNEPCDYKNRGYDPVRRDGKLYDRDIILSNGTKKHITLMWYGCLTS